MFRQRRYPLSLESLCLESIACDIQVWCKDSEYDDLTKYKYILGPFDVLHTKQIHQLLNILSVKRQVKSSYLQLLLHHNITGVDLSCCNNLVTDTLLKVVMTRCKRISWLNLTDCTKLSLKTLTQIPVNFPKLWSLSLQHISACKDTVLEQLGEHCPQLQVLYLGRCSVTDKGLLNLCGTVDKPCCSKLTDVDISETKVSNHGVEILLQTQSQLCRLSLHDLFSFQGIKYQFAVPLAMKLKSLDLSHLDINDNDFENILKICPSLSDINISHCKELTNKSLEVCECELSVLEHFRAGCTASTDFTFPGISKLLEKHGRYLKTLDISEMENIDIRIIILNCCSLETLLLSSSQAHASFVSLQSLKARWGGQTKPELLKKEQLSLCETNPGLKHLNLNTMQLSGEDHTVQLAVFMTNTIELRTLDLSFVSGVTDEVLDSFLDTSTLSSLEQLKLVGCEEITGGTLKRFIELCPSLKILDVSSCKCVTRRDYDAMLQQVKNNGYKLTIKWS